MKCNLRRYSEEQMPIPQMALPPYNGFGGHADSLQNCIALIPKPVKPDFNKQMNYAHTIMRFKCKMVEDDAHVLTMADMDREFILSYYLANDTIGIFEPPSRNSGVVGGKFLERCLASFNPYTHEVKTWFQAFAFTFSTCTATARR